MLDAARAQAAAEEEAEDVLSDAAMVGADGLLGRSAGDGSGSSGGGGARFGVGEAACVSVDLDGGVRSVRPTTAAAASSAAFRTPPKYGVKQEPRSAATPSPDEARAARIAARRNATAGSAADAQAMRRTRSAGALRPQRNASGQGDGGDCGDGDRDRDGDGRPTSAAAGSPLDSLLMARGSLTWDLERRGADGGASLGAGRPGGVYTILKNPTGRFTGPLDLLTRRTALRGQFLRPRAGGWLPNLSPDFDSLPGAAPRLAPPDMRPRSASPAPPSSASSSLPHTFADAEHAEHAGGGRSTPIPSSIAGPRLGSRAGASRSGSRPSTAGSASPELRTWANLHALTGQPPPPTTTTQAPQSAPQPTPQTPPRPPFVRPPSGGGQRALSSCSPAVLSAGSPPILSGSLLASASLPSLALTPPGAAQPEVASLGWAKPQPQRPPQQPEGQEAMHGAGASDPAYSHWTTTAAANTGGDDDAGEALDGGGLGGKAVGSSGGGMALGLVPGAIRTVVHELKRAAAAAAARDAARRRKQDRAAALREGWIAAAAGLYGLSAASGGEGLHRAGSSGTSRGNTSSASAFVNAEAVATATVNSRESRHGGLLHGENSNACGYQHPGGAMRSGIRSPSSPMLFTTPQLHPAAAMRGGPSLPGAAGAARFNARAQQGGAEADVRRVDSTPHLAGKRSVGGAIFSTRACGPTARHGLGAALSATPRVGGAAADGTPASVAGAPMKVAMGIGGPGMASGGGSYQERMQAFRLQFG